LKEQPVETRAIERAPYGRQRDIPRDTTNSRSPASQHPSETYYGQPAIKPSHYGKLVASYLFIGGIAGASQMLATVADLCGRRKDGFIIRVGRYLALGGAVTGPAFLIADLHTPERWYNMLRIFRRTSTMSIGSWTLTAFGTLSAMTAAAQTIADRLKRPFYRRAARALGVPAAASGAVVATYTGALLGATSTPLWAGASRLLPALFGTSAAATSTAALSLGAHLKCAPPGTTQRLERLALIAAGTELLLTSAIDRQWQRQNLAQPLKQHSIAAGYRGYKALAIATPLIVHGLGILAHRRSRRSSIIAAIASLAGGYLLRSVILSAGKASAKRPQDYFRFTEH
jgi:protein NrfD